MTRLSILYRVKCLKSSNVYAMMDDARNWGIDEMNIKNVRFDCDVLSVLSIVSHRLWVRCVHRAYGYGCMDRYRSVCTCDVCHACVTSTMISGTRLSCMEKFLKLPCPTCPTYQSYILVALSGDTFICGLPCQVSKIGACIRYDG